MHMHILRICTIVYACSADASAGACQRMTSGWNYGLLGSGSRLHKTSTAPTRTTGCLVSVPATYPYAFVFSRQQHACTLKQIDWWLSLLAARFLPPSRFCLLIELRSSFMHQKFTTWRV
jgi:hypothetical protein